VNEATELTVRLSLGQVIAVCITGYLTLLNGLEFCFLLFTNRRTGGSSAFEPTQGPTTANAACYFLLSYASNNCVYFVIRS
jgi:hypothetical protein